MNILSLLLLAALLASGNAQFVQPPSDLLQTTGYAGVPIRYKEVPAGICELDPNVKSFSGYADVAEDQHIFWWFFETRHGDPEEAPLTVWLNGGPGASSMMGLFQELGPCNVDYFGHVYSNPFSWTNVSNLLFIDQPNQVGFSYSSPVPAYKQDGDVVVLPNDTCPDYVSDPSYCGTYSYPNITLTANSTLSAAPNFWKTLQGFMGAFPQYARNGLNLATESYGGHYGPVFSTYIERQNDLSIPSAKELHLDTLLIGNGWFDPVINYQAYYNFTVSPGNTYDYAPFNTSMSTRLYNALYGPGNCLSQLQDCKSSGLDAVCQKADSFCANQVEASYDNVLGRDEADIRELAPDPFPYTFFQHYLNTPRVQNAIGAYTNWTVSGNGAVSSAFRGTGDDARSVDAVEDLRFLLSRNATVALYFGDADYNCNWLGGEVIASQVDAPQFNERAGYVDVQTSDGVVHGQTRQAGRFSFTRFYEAGHMVPFYQPLAALEFFERAIGGLDLRTGKEVVGKEYVTEGTRRSEFREGNATMQWEVTPENVTYDVVANRPGAPWEEKGREEDGGVEGYPGSELLRQDPSRLPQRERHGI